MRESEVQTKITYLETQRSVLIPLIEQRESTYSRIGGSDAKIQMELGNLTRIERVRGRVWDSIERRKKSLIGTEEELNNLLRDEQLIYIAREHIQQVEGWKRDLEGVKNAKHIPQEKIKEGEKKLNELASLPGRDQDLSVGIKLFQERAEEEKKFQEAEQKRTAFPAEGSIPFETKVKETTEPEKPRIKLGMYKPGVLLIEVNGHQIKLTKKEDKLLRYLTSQAGVALKTGKVSEEVLGNADAEKAGFHTLTFFLRKKLDRAETGLGKQIIVTDMKGPRGASIKLGEVEIIQKRVRQKQEKEKGKKIEIRPVAQTRLNALAKFMTDEEVSLDEVIQTLGHSRADRALTRKQAEWAMQRTVNKLYLRTKDGTASEEETAIWEEMKKGVPDLSDKNVLRIFTIKLQTWFKEGKRLTLGEVEKIDTEQRENLIPFSDQEAAILSAIILTDQGVLIDSTDERQVEFDISQEVAEACRGVIANYSQKTLGALLEEDYIQLRNRVLEKAEQIRKTPVLETVVDYPGTNEDLKSLYIWLNYPDQDLIQARFVEFLAGKDSASVQAEFKKVVKRLAGNRSVKISRGLRGKERKARTDIENLEIAYPQIREKINCILDRWEERFGTDQTQRISGNTITTVFQGCGVKVSKKSDEELFLQKDYAEYGSSNDHHVSYNQFETALLLCWKYCKRGKNWNKETAQAVKQVIKEEIEKREPEKR